ncbi:hypothetical protein [Agrobacterium tumefaciens]|uniref:hypothetical protein n=1 Tax=Agrobacterium tumefaciens TaxID=358 RepID=UPI0007144125|nr:hypothetical protein ASD74_21115 [Rhizobium sp. Root564]NTC84139.1 hypothetical protein [Agrobacterium tumefaciens]NTD11664.1 hypothetical protein [Agrobacterium tumefaciens]
MSAASPKAEFDDARAELQSVLAYHDGDTLAALQSLLTDCRNLRGHLAYAQSLTSKGFVRGWTPKIDQDDPPCASD